MTVEKNEEMPKSLRNIDDFRWFMEHSEYFKSYIMVTAARFFFENEEIIKRDIQRERKKRKEEE